MTLESDLKPRGMKIDPTTRGSACEDRFCTMLVWFHVWV